MHSDYKPKIVILDIHPWNDQTPDKRIQYWTMEDAYAAIFRFRQRNPNTAFEYVLQCQIGNEWLTMVGTWKPRRADS